MIDVIIPAYNAEKTIGRALASLVAQTRPNKFLVTIVDDGSTDNTEKEVNKFINILPIKYIKLEKNLGKPGLVRNVGIEKTRCPYIVFLDADDMLAPTAAEVLSRAILHYKPDYINSAFYKDDYTQESKDIIQTNNLTWLHGNAYSRRFLVENSIKFDDKWNEDGSFNLKCYWLAKNKYVINQPMAYWMENKESVTRNEKHFMYKISYDYILTYYNALKDLLFIKKELREEKLFKTHCAMKLAEFFLMYDAAKSKKIVNKENDIEYISIINKYISFLKQHFFINDMFLEEANERYNTDAIFPNAIRQDTFAHYCKKFKIKWNRLEELNEN